MLSLTQRRIRVLRAPTTTRSAARTSALLLLLLFLSPAAVVVVEGYHPCSLTTTTATATVAGRRAAITYGTTSTPPSSRSSSSSPSRLFLAGNHKPNQPPSETAATETTVEAANLSDVDARVLRSMLREREIVDLDAERDVRRLLERGAAAKKKVPHRPKKDDREDSGAYYSSQVLRTLADTQLWRQLKLRAGDLAETAQIWVANRAASDLRVVAALGAFAWERAVRDVARALPAAAASPGRGGSNNMFLLSANSSATAELRDVSQQVLGILKGETATAAPPAAAGRGLRTAAPAGRGSAAERQRRAYRRSQERRRQREDLTRAGTRAADAVAELRRELQSESSVPGYRTEPARRALAGAAAATGNLLEEGRQRARLAAAERREQRRLRALREQPPQQQPAPVENGSGGSSSDTATGESATVGSVEEAATRKETMVGGRDAVDATTIEGDSATLWESREESTTTTTTAATATPAQDALREEIRQEMALIFRRLQRCIDAPDQTWLPASLVDRIRQDDIFAGTGMQDAVTQMILIKAQLEKQQQQQTTDGVPTFREAVQQLATVRDRLQALVGLVEASVSDVVAAQLRRELLWQNDPSAELFFAEPPLILRLERAAEAAVRADATVTTTSSSSSSSTSTEDSSETTSSTTANTARKSTPMPAAAPADRSKEESLRQSATAAAVQKSSVATVDDDTPTVQQVEAAVAPPSEAATSANESSAVSTESAYVDAVVETPRAQAAEVIQPSAQQPPKFVDVDVIMGEMVPDTVIMEKTTTTATTTSAAKQPHAGASVLVDDGIDAASAGLIAEIVSDEDFDRAFGEAKVAVEVTDEDAEQEENKEDSIVVQAALRSLDVTFFVLEKVIAGVPGTIATTQRVAQRVAEVNRDGRGTKGWQPVKNLADAKGRY